MPGGNVGIGTTDPGAKLSVSSTGEQLRLGYNATYYASFTVANTTSKLTIATSTGTESMIKIGSSAAQNAGVSFDGGTSDYYVGRHDQSDKFMIGVGLTVGTTPAVTINSTGNVGIGTTNPTVKLEVNGEVLVGSRSSNSSNVAAYFTSGGILSTVASSIRYKKNVTDYENVLAKLTDLRPVRFTWKENGEADFGMIAEEVYNYFPDLVTYEDDGTTIRGLKYEKMGVLAIKGIQEQQGMIDEISNDQSSISNKFSKLNDQTVVMDDKLKIISNSFTALDSRMTASETDITDMKKRLVTAETKLEDDENNLLTYETTVNDLIQNMLDTETMLTQKVMSHEDRLKALEDKVATLSVQGGGTLPGNVVTQDSSGNVTLAGIFKAKEVQTGGVVAGAYAVKNDSADAPVVGTAVILPVPVDENHDGIDDNTKKPIVESDGKSIEVQTQAVSEKSKIFVTADQPEKIGVTKVKDGESFVIAVDQAVAENLNVNWFIVESK